MRSANRLPRRLVEMRLCIPSACTSLRINLLCTRLQVNDDLQALFKGKKASTLKHNSEETLRRKALILNRDRNSAQSSTQYVQFSDEVPLFIAQDLFCNVGKGSPQTYIKAEFGPQGFLPQKLVLNDSSPILQSALHNKKLQKGIFLYIVLLSVLRLFRKYVIKHIAS